MSKETNGQVRHTARKELAKALHERTGMAYTAALRVVSEGGTGRQPRDRWILSDDVRSWFAGESWYGMAYPSLYDWLDREVSPVYECDWCAEPGDAREVDSSLCLVITAYDPDLSPATMHVATRKYHAACKPSSVAWVYQADIPSGPQGVGLPASLSPDMVGGFELEVRPLLSGGGEDEGEQAVLLISARVVEDHGQGVRAWLSELELHLRGEGFGDPEGLLMGDGDSDWSLRIVTDYPSGLAPQWIAVRTGPVMHGVVPHLVLCAVDLPARWVEIARRDEQVAVVLGPCTAHWDVAGVGVGVGVSEELDDLIEESRSTAVDSVPECVCAALTGDQVAELVDAGVFIVASVCVAAENGGR